MLRSLVIAGGIAIGGLSLGPGGASAAPAGAIANSTLLPQLSLIEKSQYRRYCRRWYHECRARWGSGWRFRRCMRRHGC